MIPFQITYLDFPESDAIWTAIEKRVEKIETYYERIVRCEVVISLPHRHRQQDRLFHVQIRIIMPGDDVIINRNPVLNEANRDVYVAIRDAFNAAERQLREKIKLMKVKERSRRSESHQINGQLNGKISKIFYHDGYGFITTIEGREFYFDKNSLLNKNFELLQIGDRVKFLEELGEKGPQVTSMSAL